MGREDDYDIEITVDGAIEQTYRPDHEPSEEIVVPRVVKGYTLGIITDALTGDQAITLVFDTTRGERLVTAMEPRTAKSLVISLAATIQRL